MPISLFSKNSFKISDTHLYTTIYHISQCKTGILASKIYTRLFMLFSKYVYGISLYFSPQNKRKDNLKNGM